MKIRKINIILLVLILSIFCFAACNQMKTAKKKLTVFAAASMTETLTEIGNKYMEKNNNVEILFNFDSSGTLKTQIEEGADCDIFISASPKQMNQLDVTSSEQENPTKLDFIENSLRCNLLENKVVLVVSSDNKKNINSFNDLKNALINKDVFMSIGNADVPVGQYTKKIFEYFKLDEKNLVNDSLVTYATNVKEVTEHISSGVVDCGIIYATDAYSAKLKIVDSASVEMCGQVIYPAAVLKIAKEKEIAKDFFEYLKSDEATEVFESVGFSKTEY